MRGLSTRGPWLACVLATLCGVAPADPLPAADGPKEVARFANATENPYGAALSHDRKTFAWAGTDRSVRVWDVAAGQERCKLDHPDEIGALALNRDGTMLATTCNDGQVRLWDVTAGKVYGSIAVGKATVPFYPSVQLSPDGKTLLSRNFKAEGLCFLWDVATRQELRPLLAPEGGSQIVSSYAFSPDGKAVTVYAYRQVYLFEAGTGKLLCDFVPKAGGTSGSALLSPDGKEVVYLSKGLRAVDVATRDERAPLANDASPYALAYGPKGRLLAFEAVDGRDSTIWDAVTGEKLATWKKPAGRVRRVVFGADGGLTAVTFNSGKGELELWALPGIKVGAK